MVEIEYSAAAAEVEVCTYSHEEIVIKFLFQLEMNFSCQNL